jgi:siroheme synthase-like protein
MQVIDTNKEIKQTMPADTGGNNLFPVFLKLEEMNLLIVGGGNVGLEKLQAVLYNSPGTRIKLVAATINNEIKQLAATHSNIELTEQLFQNPMLEGADIVIVAVNDIPTSETSG